MVSPHGPIDEMADEGVARDFEGGQTSARSFPIMTVDASLVDIGDEIGFPDVRPSQRIALLAHLKVIFLAVESIIKLVRTVKDEIQIVEDIDDHRSVGDRRGKRTLASTIDQAVATVQRWREQASRSPFKKPSLASFSPDLGGA